MWITRSVHWHWDAKITLFAGSHDAAKDMAIFYSFLATCINIDPKSDNLCDQKNQQHQVVSTQRTTAAIYQ